MKKKTTSRLGSAIVDMADDLRRVGITGDDAHGKITARHLRDRTLTTAEPISPAEIRTLRARENLSQAALARYLNLTVGYVSQLERGTKQLRGPALALLNVFRRKGLEAIL